MSSLLGQYLAFTLSLVREDAPDFTDRQKAVLLCTYLEEDLSQTVRGLAEKLRVSKPAITRALDRLAEFDYIRRAADPSDRRSVLVQRTAKGSAYIRDVHNKLREANRIRV